MKLLNFLTGVLSDGTPYTISVESGELVFERGEERYTAQGPALLLDYLTAHGNLALSPELMEWLNRLARQGSYIVKSLIDEKGHWDLVTADDINTTLQQKVADADIQEAIRILLLGRRTQQ